MQTKRQLEPARIFGHGTTVWGRDRIQRP